MSANVSKIPVAKHRRLSPERSIHVISPQKSASKLPVRVGQSFNDSPVLTLKGGICEYSVRWNEPQPSPTTSPSKIPVKYGKDGEVQKQYRPQSIDLEDEFFPRKNYGSYGSPDFFQIRKLSDPKATSPPRKISPISPQTPTNCSKIPIASEYYIRSDRNRPSPPRSISSSSLKMSPASDREDRRDLSKSPTRTRSSEQLERVDAYLSPTKNLEVSQKSPPKPRRSSVPSGLKSSCLPTVGWSLQPERQEEQNPTKNSQQTDSDFAELSNNDKEIPGKARRKFEAFVMTGDRMINLAKTPAHTDFRSRYYRPPPPFVASSVPNSPIFDDESEVQDKTTASNGHDPTATFKVIRNRTEHSQRRSFVRNSKSEDQLQMENQDVEDLDVSNSVHTLINGANETSSYPNQKTSANGKIIKPIDDISPQSSNSPDLSTSSLISCSEHYNGESVLDNMSPKTASSPDTPEWSLIDSFHKSKNNAANVRSVLSPVSDIATPIGNSSPVFADYEENVSSSGNRVVISINNGNAFKNKQVISPASSTGTITPEIKTGPGYAIQSDDEDYFEEISENEVTLQSKINQGGMAGSPQSESEESDMESLRSYHPPVKIVDVPSAVRLAKRLYNLEGFKKTDVSRHLSRNNEYNQVVAEEYLKFFNFNDNSLDIALRLFLNRFCLFGETQERERVLLHFARRFVECNPHAVGVPNASFRSLDAVHTLTCAIMLLNTDLHGDAHQRKMTCTEFIENLSELNEGQNFPKDLLKGVYYSIKQNGIPWAPDVEVVTIQQVGQPSKPARLNISSGLGTEPDSFNDETITNSSPTKTSPPPTIVTQQAKTTAPIAIGKTPGGVNPFLTAPDPETAVEHKKGYVMRKSCIDPNGKKTKLGKRSWKMYFMTLRDMVLYCFKDEKSLRNPGAFDDLSQAIRVHHALAVRADHRKKQFVFRLHTADQAQYLFQTSDDKELITWIDSINFVVASLSAPQLPAPVSSAVNRFQRPLMPSSNTTLSIGEQLASHEKKFLQISQELEALQQSAESRGAKGSALQAVQERETFLLLEQMRYDTYILTLRTKHPHDA